MTPAARAAAILAELVESPDVAVLVAADIGNLLIAREWAEALSWRGDFKRVDLLGHEVAEIKPTRDGSLLWLVEDRPRGGGFCSSMEDGMAQADAVLRERGWRLM